MKKFALDTSADVWAHIIILVVLVLLGLRGLRAQLIHAPSPSIRVHVVLDILGDAQPVLVHSVGAVQDEPSEASSGGALRLG